MFFFILLILIFEGCVKKSEIPLGREIFENQSIIPSNLTAVNKTKEISGKHKETIGIPEKLPEVVEKQEEHEEKIKKAGFSPKTRAQELSVIDWQKLFVEFEENML